MKYHSSRIGAACIAITVALPLTAQAPCRAAVRELTNYSPRRVLSELSVAGQPSREVLGDGAACAGAAADTAGVLARFNARSLRVSLLSPVARVSALHGVSDPRDDGPEWTGRGLTAFVRLGATLDAGPLHATIAPDVWTAQNSPYDFIASTDSGRSQFASPWYGPRRSIDWPTRFGADRVTQADPGETAAWLSVFGADVGASTSSQRWGPGLRSNISIGSDAPGIPRAFLRTSHPVHTRVGSFAGSAFIGTLTKSRWFDDDTSNVYRTLRGAIATWSPSDSSGLAVGLSHATMRNGAWIGSARSSHPQSGPVLELNTVFASLGDPYAGVRGYVEFGRFGRAPSLRGFLTVPYQGIGYVVGVERAIAKQSGTLLITAEAQNLEQPTDVRPDSSVDFYTSAQVPLGWTQRGQLLGSATGPGSQSQWLALDWVTPRWSLGMFGERVRWNEDVLIRDFLAHPNRHDVTMRGGVRAAYIFAGQELALEASTGKRLNFQFQNGDFIPGYRTVDIAVPQLRLSLTPASPFRK